MLTFHELDNRHGSSVSCPVARRYDPRVAAVAGGKTRRDVSKESVDHGLIMDEAERLTPRVQVSTLCERDHLFGQRPDLLGLGRGSLYLFILEQRGNKRPEQLLPMPGVSPKLPACTSVSHFSILTLPNRFLRLTRFFRQKPSGFGNDLIVHLHPEAKSHLGKDLFDLVE